MALGDQTDPIPVKQNDTRPKIRGAVWQGPSQTPVNITGATVVFNMRLSVPPGTVSVSRGAAIIADGPGGIVEYAPLVAWSANNGLHQAEFEITLSDGGILTVPPGSNYIYIQVSDDIA